MSIRASGDAIPPEVSRFIENTLPTIRQKLAEWGIIDATKIAAGKSLEEHLKDWEAFLKARSNTADYVALVTGRAESSSTLAASSSGATSMPSRSRSSLHLCA